MADGRKDVTPRTDRELPGVWRLRLPLPWPGVPHGNAWAIAADGGIVLFDTGIGGKGRLRALELALAGAGFGVEDVRLLVCTHSHSDHYGLAGPDHRRRRLRALDAPGLGAHPAAGRRPGGGARAADRGRRARAGCRRRRSSATARRAASDDESGVDELREPDRELVPGVEVETDLGAWQVHHTPGHAPSHVVLHQPERRLMITGDHLLGRTVLFFDYGHTPDPVGEYLASLDAVEPLDGRPLSARPRPHLPRPGGEDRRRPPPGRREPRADPRRPRRRRADRLRDRHRDRRRGTLNPLTSGWMLQIVLAHLDHLARAGEVEAVEGSDPKRWKLG